MKITLTVILYFLLIGNVWSGLVIGSGGSTPPTESSIEGNTADGWVYGDNTTYATARSTSATYGTTTDNIYVGQQLAASHYYPLRGFLKFDTSSIPDTATITDVKLRMVIKVDLSTSSEFDVEIVRLDWSSQDPLSNANREAAYDNCLAGTADSNIWRNTSGASTDTQYTSGSLSTAYVNKSGNTYYCIRSKQDYNNTAPTGNEYIQVYSADSGTSSYRPTLIITYTE